MVGKYAFTREIILFRQKMFKVLERKVILGLGVVGKLFSVGTNLKSSREN